jgi:hypothetical protein
MPSSREIDDEIRRLMRDPDALRSERGGMRGGGGRDHYDPNQPRGAYVQAQPFDGQLGDIGAGQHLTSQSTFNRIDRDRRRRRDPRDNFESYDGRYRFLSTGPYASEPIPGGRRWVISSPTYAYDNTTGAYATISATPARPIIIDDYGQLRVTPVNPAIRRR